MIIDQLTPTSSDTLSDEIPVEQGTATFKTTWQKVLNLFKNNLALTATDIPSTDGNVQTDIDGLTTSVSSLVSAATDKVLFFSGVTCAATTGNFVQYVNSKITSNHVLVYCEFANPGAVSPKLSWTTSGSNQWLRINGTCTTATTCDVVLIKKNN